MDKSWEIMCELIIGFRGEMRKSIESRDLRRSICAKASHEITTK